MYAIHYWYRDAQYNREWSGTYYTSYLADVEAFFNMVSRLQGKCWCDISNGGDS